MRRKPLPDPHWITVEHDMRCDQRRCSVPIRAGERAFYYPAGRKFFGEKCGHGAAASADFQASKLGDSDREQ